MRCTRFLHASIEMPNSSAVSLMLRPSTATILNIWKSSLFASSPYKTSISISSYVANSSDSSEFRDMTASIFSFARWRLVFRTTFLRVFISQPSGLPLCRHSSLFAQAVQNVSCVASSASECSPNAFFAYIYRVLEAVPIAEVFRFASQNCRRQGEKSREYLVYFKIFQRGRRQFGPQSWVLRLLVQLLKHFSKQLLNPFILRVAATHVITTLIQLTVLYFFLVG